MLYRFVGAKGEVPSCGDMTLSKKLNTANVKLPEISRMRRRFSLINSPRIRWVFPNHPHTLVVKSDEPPTPDRGRRPGFKEAHSSPTNYNAGLVEK